MHAAALVVTATLAFVYPNQKTRWVVAFFVVATAVTAGHQAFKPDPPPPVVNVNVTPPPAPPPIQTALDVEMDQLIRVGDCRLTREFAARHQNVRQGQLADAWVEKNCKARQAVALPAPPVQPKVSREVVVIVPGQAPAPVPPKPQRDARLATVQTELARLNCYQGEIDGLASPELERGVNRFNSHAEIRASLKNIDQLLSALRDVKTTACP